MGSVSSDEGVTVGGWSSSGKPPEIEVFGGAGQPPATVVKGKVEEQVASSPGTRPAAAVTWNEETVS